MRKVKITLSLLIIILFGWVVGAFLKNSWNTRDQSARKIPETMNRETSMEIKNPHYSHTNEDAVKEWELNAKTARFFKEKNLVVFKDVMVTFYTKDGKRYTLSGDVGELYTDTQNIKVTGNVIGKGYQGEFHTNSLQYDAQDRKIRTQDKVRFLSKQFGVEGMGMVVDVEKEKLTLLNDIRAQGKKK
jgi:LPS export ABC transporter protein LptC